MEDVSVVRNEGKQAATDTQEKKKRKKLSADEKIARLRSQINELENQMVNDTLSRNAYSAERQINFAQKAS